MSSADTETFPICTQLVACIGATNAGKSSFIAQVKALQEERPTNGFVTIEVGKMLRAKYGEAYFKDRRRLTTLRRKPGSCARTPSARRCGRRSGMSSSMVNRAACRSSSRWKTCRCGWQVNGMPAAMPGTSSIRGQVTWVPAT